MGSATSATAGGALTDAALALQNYLDSSGVPLESNVDTLVSTYQSAWNADAANAGDQLVVDGKYGPLTQGALNVITGAAPPVNYGGAPAPTPTPPGTLVTPASSGDSMLMWLLIAAAVAGGAYLVFGRKKSVHHHHKSPGAMVEIKSNPRRRRSRSSSALL